MGRRLRRNLLTWLAPVRADFREERRLAFLFALRKTLRVSAGNFHEIVPRDVFSTMLILGSALGSRPHHIAGDTVLDIFLAACGAQDLRADRRAADLMSCSISAPVQSGVTLAI